MGLFDSLASILAGPAVPRAATQSMAMMGSPLIKALMAKHGVAMPDAGPAPDPNVVPPQVGPDLSNAGENAGNVVSALGPFDALDTGVDPSALGADSAKGIGDALTANAAHPRGFLDRVGDFVQSGEGQGALLRGLGGFLDGGLAGGIKAGAHFVDERRGERSAAGVAERKFGLQERELDDNAAWRMGQLDTQREQNDVTRQHYERGDRNDSRRIDADLYKHDTPSGDQALQSSTTRYTHSTPSGDKQLDVGERRFEHITPSGDTSLTQSEETKRNTQDNQASILNVLNAHRPQVNVRAHYTTTPERFRAEGPRLRPSEVKPEQGGGATQISSDAEYNALPSGARFMGPDGQVRIKP